MDFFDRLILASLKDGSSKSFRGILAEVGVLHNTLKRHLQHLTHDGFIVRVENVKKRRGRPEYGYSLPPKLKKHVTLILQDPSTTVVALPFPKLSQTCKHNKGRFCKIKKKTCTPHTCPHVTKEE